MTAPIPGPCQVIAFPYERVRSSHFALLDKCVIEELTPIIGFTRGSAALDEAGIELIGDLIARSEHDLAKIDGIGARKIMRIKEFLAGMGLALDAACAAWQDQHRRSAEWPAPVRTSSPPQLALK